MLIQHQPAATYAISPKQSHRNEARSAATSDTFVGSVSPDPGLAAAKRLRSAAFAKPKQSLSPTQQDHSGDRHYRPGAPERYWLHPLSEPGERFWMPGAVKQTNGQPIEGAKVEFWMANYAGEYSEQDFAGRGWQATDESGSYQLHSVRPGAEAEKTPTQINVRVSAPGFETLSTRLFFEDDIHNWRDPAFQKERELELGSLHWGNTKYFTADFDFVLKKTTN